MAGDKASILFVDDDKGLASLTSAILGGHGYRVHVANSGSEAAATCAVEKVDLAIVDFDLPDMTGFGVASHIRSVFSAIPIVLHSGRDDLDVDRSHVIDVFVRKGDGPSRLLEVIDALLQNRRHSPLARAGDVAA